MEEFVLDPRLKTDTIALGKLRLCLVTMMNDKRYPWLILIPQVPHLRELHDLDPTQSHQLMKEICGVSMQMKFHHSAEKMNVAAFGNLISQLHIHVIARFETDTAWPKPVFNQGDPIEYTPSEIAALRKTWEPLLATLHL